MSPTQAELEWATQLLVRGNSVPSPKSQKGCIEAKRLNHNLDPNREAFLLGTLVRIPAHCE